MIPVIDYLAHVASLALHGVGLWLLLRKQRDTQAASALRGQELGRMAVRYAESITKTGSADKLRAALDAFRVMDTADNGRRDYSDAQARVFIEAAVAEGKLANVGG